MKKIFTLFFILAFAKINAQQLNIIPKPSSVVINKQNIVKLNTDAVFFAKTTNNSIIEKYEKVIFTYFKKFKRTNTNLKQYLNIFLNEEKNEAEKYQIIISKSSININASVNGMNYALATLQQIFSQAVDNKIPCCTITDSPRFAYRGMHLDVARHFQPISFIKKYLGYMAMYKFNTFHWHLTDDQGWRIEIKKYPKLTSIGGWRNGTIVGRYPGTANDNTKYGGFYTQAEIKEVVEYAKEHNITVIPEIEMPGHASAAIAAYPELSCFPNEPTKIPNEFISKASKNSTGKLVQETWGVFEDVFAPTETTFTFLQNVLDEVMPLFPSQYIHIGGDECPKESWKRSEFCQQLIKEKGLKDEHGLQSYFIQRIEKYINSKGKNIIGWDEILEGGLAPNATVMSWRGEKGGIEAAKQKHNVVMTPGSHCYFDHSQSKNEDSVTIGGYLPIEKVYAYNPVPNELNAEQAKYILGAQANLWTEYIRNSSKVEYMIFPRMLALSEVLWSDTTGRNWEEFEPRLIEQMNELRKQGINMSYAIYHPKVAFYPTNKVGEIKIILEKVIPKKITEEGYFIETKFKIEKDTFLNRCRTVQIPDKIKDPSGKKNIVKDTLLCDDNKTNILFYAQMLHKKDSFSISQSGELIYQLRAWNTIFDKKRTILFSFNKATAQKITLTMPPSKGYPGNGGAFGLVNGVVSEKGINSAEWLGYAEGQDAEMVIDLGSIQDISEVKVHTLDQQGSWIYLPESMEVATSNDGVNFTKVTSTTKIIDDQLRMKYIVGNFAKTNCRYVKVWVKNFGQIPSGKPGAGHQAWLFLDEVQISLP
jgi:hexosaminidase